MQEKINSTVIYLAYERNLIKYQNFLFANFKLIIF